LGALRLANDPPGLRPRRARRRRRHRRGAGGERGARADARGAARDGLSRRRRGEDGRADLGGLGRGLALAALSPVALHAGVGLPEGGGLLPRVGLVRSDVPEPAPRRLDPLLLVEPLLGPLAPP